MILPDASSYRDTWSAYRRFVDDYGPDDFFSLKKLIEKHVDTLTFSELTSVIRLSGYDARIVSQMLPRLFALIPDISEAQRWGLFQAIHRVWAMYYPLRESTDLAFDLGNLLYALAFYEEAIVYFELSIKIYGQAPATLFNIALCLCLLGEFSLAVPIVTALKANVPDSDALRSLLEQFGDEFG